MEHSRKGGIMAKQALGRGLASLLGDSGTFQGEGVPNSLVRNISVEEVFPNPYQPREAFSDQEIQELADSISRSGLLQPIVVRRRKDASGFELVAGERRLRAVKSLGWESIPAVVRDVDTREMAVLALVENIQRQDVSPIEEARAYRRLMEEFSLSQEDVAKLVGKSRAKVANTLRLLSLPEDIQREISSGEVSFSQARELLTGRPAKEEIVRRYQVLKSKKATVREIKEEVKQKDPFVLRLEETLQQLLGTKVSLQHNERKKQGKIVIEYYSLVDLDRVVDVIRRGRREINGGSTSSN